MEWSLVRNLVRRVEFMGGDGEDPKIFRSAHIFPRDFALPPITGFLPGVEKGSGSFVNSVDNSGRKEPNGHDVSDHGNCTMMPF
jgi:hypothetical protein